MLNPQFVAGEHGLFGGHKSEDIRTFYSEYQLPTYWIKYKIRNQMLDIAIQWEKTVTM